MRIANILNHKHNASNMSVAYSLANKNYTFSDRMRKKVRDFCINNDMKSV